MLVLVWHHWLALIVGTFFFLAWSALSLPATFSIVATSLKSTQHTMGIGVQSMVRRVPMMIGPLVGGWLITRFGWERGVQYALLGCIGLSLITIVVQAALAEEESGKHVEAAGGEGSNFFPLMQFFSPLHTMERGRG